MVDEIVMDTVLQSHHEVMRSKAVCHVCHTRYVPVTERVFSVFSRIM
jgi:hypothetical protein